MSSHETNPPPAAGQAHLERERLSDLAVSPFGLPLALHVKEVRVAWVGRMSTEEHQDPRQSLVRQLERSKVALPESWVIACHFYDVESGRMELKLGAAAPTTQPPPCNSPTNHPRNARGAQNCS